jgi:mRNA interferase HicA
MGQLLEYMFLTLVLMKGNEFIKKVKQIGKARNIEVRVDKKRGKGSHVTLYLGERFTIVRNPKDELKTGTLLAMLQQLGLSRRDIEG